MCAGSLMAPNIAIRTAPAHTRIVPMKEYRVKGSPSMSVAHAELKTKPDYACVNSPDPLPLLMMKRTA